MKRRSGLQKKLSSIFDGVKLDELPAEPGTQEDSSSVPGEPAAPQSPTSSQDSSETQGDINASHQEPVASTNELTSGIPLFKASAPLQLPENLVETPVVEQEQIASSPTVPDDLNAETADNRIVPETPSKKVQANPVIFELQPRNAGKTDSEPDAPEESDYASDSPAGSPSKGSPARDDLQQPDSNQGRGKTAPTKKLKAAGSPKRDPFQVAYERKQRRSRIAVAILAVFFVGAMLWAFNPGLFQGNDAAVIEPLEPLDISLAAAPTIQWTRPASLPQELRDPMVAIFPVIEPEVELQPNPVEPEPEPVDLTPDVDLKGIVYSEDRPSVIIGINIHFVNDVIDGIRIVAIHRNEIELEKDGVRWTQSLPDPADSIDD